VRLTQIRDFVTVVECGSMRAAARRLGVSQPAVTKSVRSLEDELHVQLLGRNTRGVTLTESGRAFYPRARAAHTELRKAEQEVALGTDGGSIAIGAGPAALTTIVPDAVAQFRREFPRTHVRIVEGLAHLLLPALRDETLDLVMGVRPSTTLDPLFRFRPLFRSTLAIAARRGHPLRNARSLAALAEAEWLSTSTLAMPAGPVERMFSGAGLRPPRPLVHCDSYNTLVALVERTDMLVLLQRRLLKHPFARDCLQEIRVTETLPLVTVGMFLRVDMPLTRTGAAMAKAAVAVARNVTAAES
jgi:LysR family transcriptional regulator, regulator of abg operon